MADKTSCTEIFHSLRMTNGYKCPAKLKHFYIVRTVLHNDAEEYLTSKNIFRTRLTLARKSELRQQYRHCQKIPRRIQALCESISSNELSYIYIRLAQKAIRAKSIVPTAQFERLLSLYTAKSDDTVILLVRSLCSIVDEMPQENVIVFCDLLFTFHRLLQVNSHWTVKMVVDFLARNLNDSLFTANVKQNRKLKDWNKSVAQIFDNLKQMYFDSDITITKILQEMLNNEFAFPTEATPFYQVRQLMHSEKIFLANHFLKANSKDDSEIKQLILKVKSGSHIKSYMTNAIRNLDAIIFGHFYSTLATSYCANGIVINHRVFDRIKSWYHNFVKPNTVAGGENLVKDLKKILNQLPIMNKIILAEIIYTAKFLLEENENYKNFGIISLAPRLKKILFSFPDSRKLTESEVIKTNVTACMTAALLNSDLQLQPRVEFEPLIFDSAEENRDETSSSKQNSPAAKEAAAAAAAAQSKKTGKLPKVFPKSPKTTEAAKIRNSLKITEHRTVM